MLDHRAIRRTLVLTGLLLVVLSSLLVSSPSGDTPPRGKPLQWIISEGAVARLLATPHPEGLVRRAFDNPRTWLIVGSSPRADLQNWKCLRILSFKSYAEMKEKLGTPTGIWGVLYDPESWEFTPLEERRNVPYYAAEAARLAHSRGLQFIVTPATNLVRALVPPRPDRKFKDSVEDLGRLKLATQIAPAADVYEIQSQGAADERELFLRYVTQEAAQVRAANPRAILLAGLSTNPHGLQVTGQQVFQEVLDTLHLVEGYWLNVPQGGPTCPTCGPARPAVAIQLLELLDKKGLLE
jgi:hypothetical protein